MSTLKVNSIAPAVPGSEDYWLPSFFAHYSTTTTTTLANSGNVSSLTDNGTGNTTITFTNAISADYAFLGSVGNDAVNTSSPTSLRPYDLLTTSVSATSLYPSAIADYARVSAVGITK